MTRTIPLVVVGTTYPLPMVKTVDAAKEVHVMKFSRVQMVQFSSLLLLSLRACV